MYCHTGRADLLAQIADGLRTVKNNANARPAALRPLPEHPAQR